MFGAASPVDRIHKAAPPFLVVHGSRDSLIPVDEARTFVHTLRSVSAAPVGYVSCQASVTVSIWSTEHD